MKPMTNKQAKAFIRLIAELEKALNDSKQFQAVMQELEIILDKEKSNAEATGEALKGSG